MVASLNITSTEHRLYIDGFRLVIIPTLLTSLSSFYILSIPKKSTSRLCAYSRVSSIRMLDENSSELEIKKVASHALFHQKFVDKFPSVKSAKPEEMCFFVSRRGRYGYLSNWLLEEEGHFGEDGFLFRSSEHELMYIKAKTFSDEKMMRKIVRTKDPARQKVRPKSFWV